MSSPSEPNAATIQFLYSLWDSTYDGREAVLSWESPPQTESAITRADLPGVLRLLWHLNRIGHLLGRGFFPEGFVEEFFGKEILRCDAQLKAIVESLRVSREDPQYLEYIDSLVDSCKARWPRYAPIFYAKATSKAGF